MRIDHVTFADADGEATAAAFRERYGLASFAGGYLPHLGARSWSVLLEPPAYVEWLAVEDRDVAATRESGRRLLDRVDSGGGLLAWTVLVDDIAAASERVGVPVFEGTTKVASGADRRWYTVTRDLGLPVLISYDDPDGSRTGRWRAAFEGVGHTCAPYGFTRVDVGGDPAELAAWLGPHDLPVAFAGGPPGIRAAHVATANGTVVLT